MIIKVPATSANLGSGFDSLGIALSLFNEVEMEESDCVDIASLDEIAVPTGEDNLIFESAKHLFDLCGKQLRGLKLRQRNRIPMTRGLGSSSACIVAGLLGANILLGEPMSRSELVNIANSIEGHPDNTTPALLGGLVTSAVANNKVYSVSVPVAKKLRFAAFIPPFELKTSVARRVLPTGVSREDAVYNLSRSALMTASLFSGNVENLRVSVEDRIHQPYRLHFIEKGEDIFALSYEFGSYGTYISGAGPTIMSIIERGNKTFSRKCLERMAEKGINGWEIVILEASGNGAFAEYY
ncbi:MAG: homoserine kinase [Oscillospiraceae bacterium]|nr:homoserine kinase [Oscillospiraceae bacterium]